VGPAFSAFPSAKSCGAPFAHLPTGARQSLILLANGISGRSCNTIQENKIQGTFQKEKQAAALPCSRCSLPEQHTRLECESSTVRVFALSDVQRPNCTMEPPLARSIRSNALPHSPHMCVLLLVLLLITAYTIRQQYQVLRGVSPPDAAGSTAHHPGREGGVNACVILAHAPFW
jgi:hypothetical protein